MARRSKAIKQHRTKRVRVRNANEHVQGTSVRTIEPDGLPTGCAQLVGAPVAYPCTRLMAFVQAKFEQRWVPEEQEFERVFKLIGWCKTHRPRNITEGLLELPTGVSRVVNGPKSQRARIRRMEAARYIKVVPQGGSRMHDVDRSSAKLVGGSQWVSYVDAACGMTIKRGYWPKPSEERDYTECPKCVKAREVVSDTEPGGDV